MDKQHILDEIKRTTLANGGVPLGKQLFLKETGIKESDWSGKIWSRWSEAVSEAGYKAQILQGPNDKKQAFLKVIALTRRLGRLPTIAEMKLEKRIDESFPSKSIRGASKDNFVVELLKICQSDDSHRDVEQILKKVPLVSTKSTEDHGEQQNHQSGLVYLMLSGKHYKIGLTSALYRRASQIANANSHGAELIHSFETDDPRGIEAYWHNRFADKRIKGVNVASGEWFALSKSDVAAFCKRKRFM